MPIGSGIEKADFPIVCLCVVLARWHIEEWIENRKEGETLIENIISVTTVMNQTNGGNALTMLLKGGSSFGGLVLNTIQLVNLERKYQIKLLNQEIVSCV